MLPRSISRHDSRRSRRDPTAPFRHLDPVLLVCSLALALIGVVSVYSATRGPGPHYVDHPEWICCPTLPLNAYCGACGRVICNSDGLSTHCSTGYPCVEGAQCDPNPHTGDTGTCHH